MARLHDPLGSHPPAAGDSVAGASASPPPALCAPSGKPACGGSAAAGSAAPGGSAAAGPSSSLERLETNDETLPPQSRFAHWAHRLHWRPRRSIYAALNTSAHPRHTKRAARIAACCCSPELRFFADAGPRLCRRRCRDRMCPLCSQRRSADAADRAVGVAASMDSCRFITLTLAASDAPLADQLAHLRDSFRRLRADARWKEHVVGGVYTVELTFNAKTRRWHPHLHALVDGGFFPQPTLKAAWEQASGGSYIVDIRACHGRRAAARYIAKYATKPTEMAAWPPEAIRDAADALHGLRTLSTFGAYHGVKLDTADPNEDPADSVAVADANRLDNMLAEDPGRVTPLLARIVRANPELTKWWPDLPRPPDLPQGHDLHQDAEAASLSLCWLASGDRHFRTEAPPPCPSTPRIPDPQQALFPT